MLFNSLHFLFFFPAILLLVKFSNAKYRILISLIASYYFYMSWKVEYIGLILLSTIVDYCVSIKMDDSCSLKKRKAFLLVSIILNLGILFIFKYYNFFISNINQLLELLSYDNQLEIINVTLPVGISFYTFQTLSYTFDVYNKKIKAEKNFLNFALYVSYWPQLVAGPIERASSLLPQLKNKIKFSPMNMEKAVTLIAIGFFKKVVIADKLGIYVDEVYSDPSTSSSLSLIFATYFFAIQIYCDFSGYTDIARGCSLLIGINLIENFKAPYLAGSITNFWRRWHISLTKWFTEYLYIPLGGNRISSIRTYVNIGIVFLISGLWHGANWTYIVWGSLHGLFLMLERIFKIKVKEIKKITSYGDFLRIIFTFHLVLLTWVFFRAKDIKTSIYILKKMFLELEISIGTIGWSILPFSGDNLAINNFIFSIFLIIGLFVLDRKRYQTELEKNEFKSYNLSFGLILLIIFFGEFYKNSFIYFQF